jgi:CheY-like chemotaxis protein
MPRLNGHELLRAFKANPMLANVPFLLLSARADAEERVLGLKYAQGEVGGCALRSHRRRAGADDYLAKPFSAPELGARVDRLLELYSARAGMARRAQEHSGLLKASEDRASELEMHMQVISELAPCGCAMPRPRRRSFLIESRQDPLTGRGRSDSEHEQGLARAVWCEIPWRSCNPRLTWLAGASATDPLDAWVNYIEPSDKPRVLAAFGEAIATKAPKIILEYRCIV